MQVLVCGVLLLQLLQFLLEITVRKLLPQAQPSPSTELKVRDLMTTNFRKAA